MNTRARFAILFSLIFALALAACATPPRTASNTNPRLDETINPWGGPPIHFYRNDPEPQ